MNDKPPLPITLAGWALVLLVTFASCTIRYDCCRKAGFDHKQCMYQTSCN